jgi:hypothetical protein
MLTLCIEQCKIITPLINYEVYIMKGFILGVIVTLAVIYPDTTKVVLGKSVDFVHGVAVNAAN